MELDSLAAHLARGLVRALGGKDEAGRVLLLAEPNDPLGEYLRKSMAGREVTVTEETEQLPMCRGVVLIRLTAQIVCEVWSGVCLSRESGAVFQALLTGKPVWAPEEGGFRASLARNPVGARVKERFFELRRAGLMLLPAGEIVRRATETGKRRG